MPSLAEIPTHSKRARLSLEYYHGCHRKHAQWAILQPYWSAVRYEYLRLGRISRHVAPCRHQSLVTSLKMHGNIDQMYVTPFAAEAARRGGNHSSQSCGRPSENTDSSFHSSLHSSVSVRLRTSASSVGVRLRVERESERPRTAPVVVTVVVAGAAVTGMGSPMGGGNTAALSLEPRESDTFTFTRP